MFTKQTISALRKPEAKRGRSALGWVGLGWVGFWVLVFGFWFWVFDSRSTSSPNECHFTPIGKSLNSDLCMRRPWKSLWNDHEVFRNDSDRSRLASSTLQNVDTSMQPDFLNFGFLGFDMHLYPVPGPGSF